MTKLIKVGDCVKIPDGRIARVRKKLGDQYIVRVRRTTSNTHQFLKFEVHKLEPTTCPKGWMSPAGYNRYLKATLAKMEIRLAKKKKI